MQYCLDCKTYIIFNVVNLSCQFGPRKQNPNDKIVTRKPSLASECAWIGDLRVIWCSKSNTSILHRD